MYKYRRVRTSTEEYVQVQKSTYKYIRAQTSTDRVRASTVRVRASADIVPFTNTEEYVPAADVQCLQHPRRVLVLSK